MVEASLEEVLELIWTIGEENSSVDKDVLLKRIDLPEAEQQIKTLMQRDYIKITGKKSRVYKKRQERCTINYQEAPACGETAKRRSGNKRGYPGFQCM